MPHGSCSVTQLFLALCVATGLAAACVLLATAEPLTSTPAELRGSSAARRLSRGVSRHSSDRRSTLRRLSGAAKGRRKADGPPPAGITVSYTPEEGYRSEFVKVCKNWSNLNVDWRQHYPELKSLGEGHSYDLVYV